MFLVARLVPFHPHPVTSKLLIGWASVCYSSIIRAILVEQLDVRVKSLLVRVRPHIPSRLEQPREAEIRRVHGAFASIHEDIVEEASKGCSTEWCNHRDL